MWWLGHWAGDRDCPHSKGGGGGRSVGGRSGGRGRSGGDGGGRKHSYFCLDHNDMPSTRGDANMADDSEDSVASIVGDGSWQKLFLSGDEAPSNAAKLALQEMGFRVNLRFKPNFASWSSGQLRDHLCERRCMVYGSRDELIVRLGNYYDGGEVEAFGPGTGKMTSIFHKAPVQTGKSQGSPNTWTKPEPRTQVRHSGSSASSSGAYGGLS